MDRQTCVAASRPGAARTASGTGEGKDEGEGSTASGLRYRGIRECTWDGVASYSRQGAHPVLRARAAHGCIGARSPYHYCRSLSGPLLSGSCVSRTVLLQWPNRVPAARLTRRTHGRRRQPEYTGQVPYQRRWCLRRTTTARAVPRIAADRIGRVTESEMCLSPRRMVPGGIWDHRCIAPTIVRAHTAGGSTTQMSPGPDLGGCLEA